MFGLGGEGQLGEIIAPQVDPSESLRDMLSSGNYAKVSRTTILPLSLPPVANPSIE